MDIAHQHLTIAVGAAKEHARALVVDPRAQMTGRSSSLYLSLVVMHRRLLAPNPQPPSVQHFIPDLEHLVLLSKGQFVSVRPLLEAALRIARDDGGGRGAQPD
jgi:hypothetical protein